MTDLPILRTEVYPGALDGDDRNPADPTSTEIWFGDGYTRYPNAMGSQPGPIYTPGPAALTDGDPNTFIRMSSAWAADWFVILDGSSPELATATQITITILYNVRYLDPQDQQYWDASIELFDFTSQSEWAMHGLFTTEERLGPGVSEVTVVLDQAWIDAAAADPETLNGSWPGDTFAEARDGILMGPNKEVLLLLSAQGGALPYEVDVTDLSVSIPGPAPAITGDAVAVRRRFARA